MFRFLIALVGLFYVSSGLLISNNAKPVIIPPLREWKGGTGEFAFENSVKITINPIYYDELISSVETFSEDIYALKGYMPEVIKSNNVQMGGIHFTLGISETSLGTEGYYMEISDAIEIKANSSAGAFYATRTILQLLKYSDNIPKGSIKDYPLTKERAFFIDNGRKYFTIDWLVSHIKEISYLKYNYFDFYLGDNRDFRIQCDTYPEIVSEEHYTKDDILYLQRIAKKYNITIVPCINMPGHMGAILKPFADKYALKDSKGGISTTFLDIVNPESRKFAKSIIDEYIGLFDGPYWHLGADEYNYTHLDDYPQFGEYAKSKYGLDAQPIDAFIDFVNWANEIVKSHGKKMRIYNDCMSVLNTKNLGHVGEISKDIVIDYWEGGDQPQQYIDEGYEIMNCSSNFLYYNLGSPWKVHTVFIYENWLISQFEAKKPVQMHHPNHLGTKFFVWCNTPKHETEWHIANEIKYTLRALSTRMWSEDKPTPEFEDFVLLAQKIGHSPGVEFPLNPMPANLAFGKSVFSSSTATDSIYKPDFINDGSYNSNWKSLASDSEWVYVDLADTFDISEFKLVWHNNRPNKYEIQLSVDKNEWATVYSDVSGTGRIDYIELDSAVGRYVRVLMSGNYNKDGFQLWEMEIYGDEHEYKKDDSTLNNINDKFSRINFVKIYPNPTSSIVNIEYNTNISANICISIYNVDGELIDKPVDSFHYHGTYNLQYELNIASTGKYWVIVNCDGEINAKEIIVVR